MERETVVILGASNVYHSLPWLLSRLAARGTHELFLACGPGRSYGMTAGNLIARYPGIREAALFNHLEPAQRGARLKVVVADVGNDLIYEQTPEKVSRWVEEVIMKFEALGAEISWVELPYESLKQISAPLFYAFRSLYYWHSDIDKTTMLGRVEELQERLYQLSRDRGIEILPVSNDWFTVDRFHLKARHFGTAWNRWLGGDQPAAGPLWSGWAVEPSRYWLLGRERRCPVSRRLANGLLVHSF